MKAGTLRYKINFDVLFTVDTDGVSVINKQTHEHKVIKYPDAAVWLVLANKHSQQKSFEILKSVLGRKPGETKEFISRCIETWENENLISPGQFPAPLGGMMLQGSALGFIPID